MIAAVRRAFVTSIGLDCKIGAILTIALGFVLIFAPRPELQSQSCSSTREIENGENLDDLTRLRRVCNSRAGTLYGIS